MRSVVWTGHLHFGLVVMPVSLFAAARAETTRFKRIHRRKKPVGSAMVEVAYVDRERHGAFNPNSGDDFLPEHLGANRERFAAEETDSNEAVAEYEYSPVRQVLRSEVTGEEVCTEELVKGYEYGPNQFAVIEPAVIERAAVKTSDTIDLFHFVKAEEVDPLYFERSYYVAPDQGGEKAYALLLEAMRKEGYFGVARVGMHKHEHMLILRPRKNCIVAHTMFYVNEVRRAPEFEVDGSLVNERELSVARALIKGYSGVFEPEKFKDIYQERIKGLIHEELSRGANETPPTAAWSEAIVPDLTESIRLSLAEVDSKDESRKSGQQKKSVRQSNGSKKKDREKVPA
jgi:DNA end-binding protein Ku